MLQYLSDKDGSSGPAADELACSMDGSRLQGAPTFENALLLAWECPAGAISPWLNGMQMSTSLLI
jgi:hypothetical protein